MRIVHVADHFHPWMGYQEPYIALEQTIMEHDVLVISSNRYGRKPGRILGTRHVKAGYASEEGINTLRLPVLFELPTDWAYPWLRGLEKEISEFKPDIVHCHGILSFSNLRAAFLKNKLDYKLVVDNHSALFNVFHPDESMLKRFLKTLFQRGVARSFGKLLINKADAIIAIGEPEQQFVRWLFGSASPKYIPIIRLGADHQKYRFSMKNRQRNRSLNNWSEDLVVIGHAGRINKKKGIEDLLKSVIALPESTRSKIIIHLIGEIDPKFELQLGRLVIRLGLSSQFVKTGFVSTEELSALMCAWDIAVWAGDISNTALEAMSAARALVAARTPYTESIIEKYNAGILFDRMNLSELSSIIELLVTNSNMRLEMGQNARKAIEQDLNWKAISREFINLYHRLMEGTSP